MLTLWSETVMTHDTLRLRRTDKCSYDEHLLENVFLNSSNAYSQNFENRHV